MVGPWFSGALWRKYLKNFQRDIYVHTPHVNTAKELLQEGRSHACWKIENFQHQVEITKRVECCDSASGSEKSFIAQTTPLTVFLVASSFTPECKKNKEPPVTSCPFVVNSSTVFIPLAIVIALN